ncbi:hypothetical protein [Streptomyces hesseae]|uniref:Uncharacterized protein n=1 Tax=Streptomyces hesseae TaxID=3075519 RepID=A0ABU2SRY2_9ACTN|nr:hypothetical protein [Streptomyces sp. DSM 40473]MDT0451630.1 hypothetical protein [Streptomyces sp. DSM 40473]
MNRPEHLSDPDPTLNVEFRDSLVPRITAGGYTLTASQTLTGAPEYLPTADKPVTRHIEVRAPRFTVEPEWVHGAYPPPGATGLYDDVLPHLTLDRPTLPWEREEHTDDDGKRLPWLALLVFGEGELPGDPHCLGQTDQRTVAQLTGHEDGVVLPAFDTTTEPIADDETKTVCRTVLVPPAVFHAVAPAQHELPLLTHVRHVNEQHQGVTLTEDRIRIGDYAVVTGNRLPSPDGGRYVAHLVSLEGWLDRLPSGEEAEEAYTGTPEQLRLISLWSWSFETLADHAPGFAALTEHFVDTEGKDGTELLLRVPVADLPSPSAEQREVTERLHDGYLPVSCRTESGRATFGWYRGPLVAQPVKEQSATDRRRCAAEALIHLEQYGVFDVSLATAFTAGRGVALSDHQFAAALLRLRGKVRTAAEQALNPTPAGAARARIEHLAAGGLVGHLREAHRQPVVASAAANTVRAAVTPVAGATALPALADITVQRLRDDAELRDRLGKAVGDITGGSGEPAGPDEDFAAVRDWLLRLRNLTGVPFAHLVPDARMLPAESLRFFHVDADWTTTLVEGALSVGLAHRFDFTGDDLLFGPQGALPEPTAPVTGMLLRSRLVSGWPALEIRPYANPTETGGETPLTVLRREALAEDVLLVLFEGVPGRVEIAEPQQGVHFGIDEPDKGRSDAPLDDGMIRLRSVKAETGPIGQEMKDAYFPKDGGGLRDYVREPGEGSPGTVLRTGRLADGLAGALGLQPPLSPARFAIQMINAAQRRIFTTAPVTTGDHRNG